MRFADILAQVLEEEIEYQPDYFVWQMEREIRDQFLSILNAALKAVKQAEEEDRGGNDG